LSNHVATLHTALGECLATEREKFERKANEFEIRLAKLSGAIDILRGAQPLPPAKFPSVKAWSEDTIFYQGDIVIFAGGTYQAQRDTARAPWTEDWVQLASPGAPGKSLQPRGTFDPAAEYGALDVVALNGSSFIALRDQPGACPGANWQLVASCGCRGSVGERGEHGRAATIASWQIDRNTYVATPILSDGSAGALLQLRELFHRGHLDIEREVGEALGMPRNKLLDQIEPQLKKISALELKLAELTGAVDVLRSTQPPPPAKFPTIRVWSEDTIFHEGDIVAFAGGTYQATKDTARAPPSRDWTPLAVAGSGFTIRGTYNGNETYKHLDVVMLNGSSFVALKDNPGRCPGDNWHLLASCGSRGRLGPTGKPGETIVGPRGERGPTIRAWEIDSARYTARPIMTDGSRGPALDLRPLFEQFFLETANQ